MILLTKWRLVRRGPNPEFAAGVRRPTKSGRTLTLSTHTQAQIIEATNAYWTDHTRDVSFAELISGKEPGHRMADYVDDRTCSLLKVTLDTRYEGNGRGAIRKRSMGDIWVRSQGIYNPVNVKSGLQGMRGQPNVVSMRKLLDYILKRQIDSYYLLIVKFDLSENITHKLYLVDLLDWIDFITYDAGPGQIMLREQELYDKIDSGHIPVQRTIFEKVESLFNLFERQLIALFENRQRRLNEQRTLAREFEQVEFTVDQSQMEFIP